MKQIKKTLMIFIASIFVLAGIFGNVVAKATVVNPVIPIINYVGVDHSPLVVGDTETFTATSSKYEGLVQYRAFLFDGKTWRELTSGYGTAVNAKTPYILPETPSFKLGKYKLSVWVKRAGTKGVNVKGYDTYYAEALNCVTKDNESRVYASGAPKVETNGLTFKFNGIENIGGIKGPYLYRLYIYNPRTGAWTSGASEYTQAPSYTFKESGTYMVIVHVNTVNSPTWANYLAGKPRAYEAFKTIMVTVNNSVEIFKCTIKPADTGFGAIGSVTLTADGIKNYPEAKKYQIFDGTTPVSDIADLGTATTVFPAKVAGDMVNVKLLDASAALVKEIPVALGQPGTINAISDGTDITSKFTDKDFKSYVYSLIGKTSRSPILYGDVKNIKSLNISTKNMSNLNGIEYFKALTELYCNNITPIWDLSATYTLGLTSLDVSKNTALTKLRCSYNSLKTLDLSKNPALTELHCDGDQLTTLDVSKNSSLTFLSCGGNQLAVLDLSKNPSLTSLSCGSNQLATLDVSKNLALTFLSCGANQLTTLDVSANITLAELECTDNKLTTLDVSKNAELPKLNCSYNQLTSLYINPALTKLECYFNQLISLDVSKNTALTDLNVQSNKLATLDISKNTALIMLNCDYNELTTLDISKNIVLTNMQCGLNQITTLFCNNELTAYYNQFDWYKVQYTDSSHTKTTETLVLTAKN